VLREFLQHRRSELLTRWTLKVARRPASVARPSDGEGGIPFFLDQLLGALQAEQAATVFDGHDFLRRGFTAAQVVHDCGDLGAAIAELAFEYRAVIELNEFRTLDRCLDNAIAVAVAEFSFHRNPALADHIPLQLEERLEMLSIELRNRTRAATLALTAIRLGHVSPNGATGAALDKALTSLSSLIDDSLADLRGTAARAMPSCSGNAVEY
jgi:hypothetical protein